MNNLQAQLSSIESQLNAIDLGALRMKIETSETDAQEFESDTANTMGSPQIWQAAQRLREAVGRARLGLQSAENAVRSLERDRAHLDSMLHADEQIAATEVSVTSALAAVAEAARALASAQALQNEVEAMLAVAQRDHDAATGEASDALLAALRSGARPPAPTKSNRGHLDALVQAHTTVVADAQAAQAELNAAQTKLDTALQDRLVARASLTDRSLHVACRAHALALATHEATCALSRTRFDAPNLDVMTNEAKHELETVGDPGAEAETPWGAEAL